MDKQRTAIELGARYRIGRVAVVMLLAGLVAPKPALGQMATGTYTGDGVDNRAITGVGFQPDVVIVKRYPNKNALIRTSTMTGDASKKFVGSGLFSNTIQSLDADGFTVGTDDFINQSSEPYHWIAFKAAAGSLKVGTYTGDGTDNRSITGVGFQPDYVIMAPENSQHPYHRSSAMAGDASAKMDGSALSTNRIQALEPDGFQVGSDAAVNNNTTIYHYVAWKAVAGQLEVGSYAGDSSDNRNIAVSFQPKWVVVQANTSVSVGDGSPGTIHRPDTMTGDVSINFNWAYSSTTFADCIQALQTTGFQVGTNQTVNQSGKTYYWMAFGGKGYRMDTGTYTGDGIDNRGITGVGFQPDVVFVKQDSSQRIQVRTSTMTGDASKSMAATTSLSSNRIQSLDSDGFTVGTNGDVNGNGANYRWIAFQAGAGRLHVDSYTGNGSDNRSITGVGFQPDYLIVIPAGSYQTYQRFSSMSGDTSVHFGSSATTTNRIQALEADGFQVGSSTDVNASGEVYHYVAWKSIAGQVGVGTYTGDGTDDRSIAGLGFKPGWMVIKATSGDYAVHRPDTLTGDATQHFNNTGNFSDGIQALEPDGFQVGTHSTVNTNGTTYHWAAFINPGAGIPALTLTNHDAGQESDAFTQSGGETDAELFGFNLDAGGDTIAVTELVFQLSNISGLTDPDWTFGEIVVDDDGDGTIDVGETTTVGGVETVDQAAGTITFPVSFNVSSATNYILRMDFSSLSEGDTVRISLNSADVTTAYIESGSTSAVTHSEVTPALGWMATGTYTGDGTDNRAIIEVGFQPDVVIVKGDGKNPYLRSSTMTGDVSKQLVSNESLAANHIQSLDADGFTVGSDAEVNQGSTAYYWIAFQASAGQLDVGTYVGNTADNRSIGGVGFQPDYLIVMSEGGRNTIHRSSAMVGDASIRFSDQNMDTDKIQAFEASGFQLGTHNHVNASGETFHYVAFKAVAEQMSVGSYTGDGADDRDITDVGFQPGYLIIKGDASVIGAHRTSDVVGDLTLDFKNGVIYANGIQAFQATGFQVGTNSKVNQSANTYYWMAFNNAPASSSPRIISWTEVDPHYP